MQNNFNHHPQTGQGRSSVYAQATLERPGANPRWGMFQSRLPTFRGWVRHIRFPGSSPQELRSAVLWSQEPVSEAWCASSRMHSPWLPHSGPQQHDGKGSSSER